VDGSDLARLAEQEAFHVSPVASLVLDPGLRIVAVNAAYREATGNRDDLVGAQLFEAFPANPDDPADDGVAKLRASLGRVARTGRRHHMVVQRYDIPGPDGAFVTKWWSPVNTPIRRDGALVGLLHQVDDVTDLAEDSLRVLERARALVERLPDKDSDIGARFTLGVEQFATAVARQTALVSELAQLRQALSSRAAIDMAKGLVMAERRCGPDEAFAILTELANHSQIRVSEVATALVYQAQVPGAPILPIDVEGAPDSV
jgi:response regulator NasT